MNIQELLELLSRNEAAARELAEARKAILAALESAVLPGDQIAWAGYQAQWKPGRRSTDHEAVAKYALVPESVIKAHTTVKTTVAWAKITKAANVPKEVLDRFTTQAEPSFVVEPINVNQTLVDANLDF